VENAIPFVPKAGGHSLWSTIGGEGFILDLSLYTGTQVDTVKQTVTMKGGTLAQEVYDTVYDAGFCFSEFCLRRYG
jgi:FAD/FMN-containing dehydrogenase